MLKKLLVLLTVLAMLFCFSVPVMANGAGHDRGPIGYYQHTITGAIKYFPNGHPGSPSQWTYLGEEPPRPNPCDFCNATSVVNATTGFGFVEQSHPSEMGYGAAFGDVTLTAEAIARGTVFAIAHAVSELEGKVYVLVMTTGEKGPNGGLSMTYVKSIGILEFDAEACALAGFNWWVFRCPSYTVAELHGVFKTFAAGYSLSEGPNGSYAFASADGTTSVLVNAFANDFDIWGIFSNAHVDLHGVIIVKQDLVTMSYVSSDGTTSWNFAKVEGGNAMEFGDANILGIRASGNVFQEGLATDGLGTVATGWSSASFEGASGYVMQGRCGSFANANGLAVVQGYNNVTNSGNTVNAISVQSAYATTGGISPGLMASN